MSRTALVKWQRLTLVSLFAGYSGYYLCRSNLSVATPLLLEAYGSRGLDKEAIGLLASIGVLVYAVGKLLNGILCDFIGGRRTFLFGLFGSVACTVAFGLGSGMAYLTLVWCLGRFAQSGGWSALVKVASNWFPFERYGRVMGQLSLSFLFGDVLARLFLGELIRYGLNWRQVFLAAAAALGLIGLVLAATLRERPEGLGAEEPQVNPANLYGDRGSLSRPESLRRLLAPLIGSLSFWLVMTLSLGLTLIRETFNLWTPTYLTEAVGLSPGSAASFSLLYPLFGGISVLAAGALADRFASGNRAALFVPALALLVPVLAALGSGAASTSAPLALTLVSLAALLMIGPYALLSGAIALDLGGKYGSSTAAGMVDSAGYFGGVISGYGIGRLAERGGWGTALGALAGVAALTCGAAVAYWLHHQRTARSVNGGTVERHR